MMSDSLNIYQKWLGIPLDQQPPHAYRLLGIELFEPDPDVVAHAADRQMAHVRTFNTGAHVRDAQKLLNEIAAARVQLLNPARKADYDAQLHAQLARSPSAQVAPLPRGLAPAAGHTPPVVNVGSLPSEAEPVWRHPAVLAGAAVCFVLVVAIAAAIFLKLGRTPVADATDPATTIPEIEDSPGRRDEVPVDPNESSSTDPANTTNPSGTSTNSTSSDTTKTATNPPANTTSTKPPNETPTKTSTDPTKTTPVNTAGTGTKTPDDPRPAETLSSAFTPDDPGPPEPDEASVLAAGGDPLNDPPAQPKAKPIERLAVPAADAAKASLAEVRKIFSSEYEQAKTLDERRKLADFLLRQARGVEDDPVARYVLLCEARDQAETGGDFDLTMRAIDTIDQEYIIKAIDQKVAVLTNFSRSARTTAARHVVATAAITLANAAIAERDFDTAEKLAIQSQSLAQRVGDNNLRLQGRTLANDIKKQRALWAVIQGAMEKLAASPEDPAANLIFGKYLCLTEQRWDEGLAHVARGGDTKLSPLASRDLAALEKFNQNRSASSADDSPPAAQPVAPADVAEWVALGDAWHDLATSDPALDDFQFREHEWYLRALPDTTGLVRTKVEKRLRENPKVRFRRSWLDLPPSGEKTNAASDSPQQSF